jgi:hypothetical protein
MEIVNQIIVAVETLFKKFTRLGMKSGILCLIIRNFDH